MLKDVLDTDENLAFEHRNRTAERWRKCTTGKVPTLRSVMGTGGDNVPYVVQRARGKNNGGIHTDKCPTITGQTFVHNNHVVDGKHLRVLTLAELEQLQGLPEAYTYGVSMTQRRKAIGNGFHTDVIAHILSYIPRE